MIIIHGLYAPYAILVRDKEQQGGDQIPNVQTLFIRRVNILSIWAHKNSDKSAFFNVLKLGRTQVSQVSKISVKFEKKMLNGLWDISLIPLSPTNSHSVGDNNQLWSIYRLNKYIHDGQWVETKQEGSLKKTDDL